MATQHHTRLSLRIIEALRNSFDTALFFATMAVKENFRNHVARAGAIGMNPARRIAILGNGPALRHEMPVIGREAEQQACDIMAVNFFALGEEFETLRPKYYVLSDPQFFRRSGRSERVEALYKALDSRTCNTITPSISTTAPPCPTPTCASYPSIRRSSAASAAWSSGATATVSARATSAPWYRTGYS